MTSALFPVISFRYFSLLLLGALLSVLMEVLNSSFRNDKIRMSKHVSLCRRFSGILLSLHFTYGMQMQSYFTNTEKIQRSTHVLGPVLHVAAVWSQG